MSEPNAPKPPPRPRRRWLRRIAFGFLWLLLLLIVFHRPIVHYGGRWLAIRIAAGENIALDLRIEGNLWSRFELHDIRATATGPAPIERLTLDRAILDYSVWKLIRGDLSGLHAVEVGALDAVITPEAVPEKPKKNESKPLSELMRTLFAKPFPTATVKLGRADVRVKQRAGDIVVRNLRLTVAQEANGVIGWDRIEVPGIPPLEASSGVVSRNGDYFAISTLSLFPEATIEKFRIDRSAGGIELVTKVAGGRMTALVKPAATGSDVSAVINAEQLNLGPFAERFGAKLPVKIALAGTKLDVAIDPERPESARISVVLNGDVKSEAHPTPAPFAVNVNLREGNLDISALSARFAGVELNGTGKVDVSPFLTKIRPANPQPGGEISFTLKAPDLAPLGAEVKQPMRGSLDASGKLVVAGGTAKIDASINGAGISASGVTISKTAATIRAELPMAAKEPLRALVADLSATIEDIAQTPSQENANAPATVVRIDRVRANAGFRDLRATLGELAVERGTNSFRATGTATLNASGKVAAPPEVSFKLDAPALAEFGIAVNGALLGGTIVGEGKAKLDVAAPATTLTGNVKIESRALVLGDTPIGELALDTDFANGSAVVKSLSAKLAGGTTFDASASAALAPPHAYTGSVKFNAPDLSAFESLAAIFGVKEKLGGSVSLDWQGKGDITKHDGTGHLTARAVRFGSTVIAETKLAANYSPEKVETSDLLVVADKLRATGKLLWAGKRLEVSGLELRLADETVLTGSLTAPLDPQAKQPITPDQPISAKLDAVKLDLAKLFSSLGQRPPATGTVTLKLDASGTVAQPSLTFDLDAKDLAVTPPPPPPKKTVGPRRNLNDTVRRENTPPKRGGNDASPLSGIATTIRVTYKDDVAKLSGSVRHPELKPITLSAELPLELAPLLEGQKPDLTKIPLKAHVEMPASSVAFVTKLAPVVRQLDGTAAVDVRATGTVGTPRLEGSASLDVKSVRMEGSLPAVTGLTARLAFAGDTLTVERLSGETGGGKFSLGGKINLEKSSDPVFDLSLKADDVLAVRDDSIVVRVDTDLTLRGPLSAAAASGAIFVTQSRYSKEVEILPLALPGRPKPRPRAVSQPKVISFPDKPLRDWKFDIAIKSRVDDAFRIRGNLTRGEATLDLRLAGTGLAPYLTGAVRIDRFRAVLPASTLNTRRGLVTFSQDAPFEPRLDIEAESLIQRYNVIARIDGPATEPRLDLSSQPPLPQSEILSLLTTGSLTSDVSANNRAVATRAAILVIREWYRKVFKKEMPELTDEGGSSFMDRFEVEFGNVDARTGQNEVSAQFRATDNLFFLGDLDLRGEFTGRVKYLIRFR